MERSGQQWVTDSLVASLGFDLVFPDAYIGWLEQGMRLQDYRRSIARVRSAAMMCKAWSMTAEDLLRQAESCAEREHTETALEFYHRAAFAYCKAFWANKNAGVHRKLKDSYAKAAALATHTVERVEIPFGEHTVFGILHVPDVNEPAPCVVFAPGMDMVKEEYPNLQENRFVKRGMACLSIDGPGQGETWLHGLTVTPDNYAEAGSAAVDFVAADPRIDSERIGVFGCSMGSYWAPTIAAKDDRVKACAAAMGNFLQKDTIFKHAPPAFRRNFMEMSGIFDDDEFDRMAERMTLARFAEDISCPILLLHGEFDQLCPLSDAREFMAMLNCPKELWVFENEFHGLGRQRGEMFAWAADWLRDKVNGRYEKDLDQELWIPEPA
ncbi:MAG: alpha/beta hydrolase [Acidothermales bacterium]|nr:alpha/beta hydrolase [Acidothermales bacterium]